METASDAPMVLGDLLGDPGLGLELLVGEADARGRAVEGAHSIEVHNPTRWLDAGWVMLTTGIALSEDDAAQREFIRELDDNGVVALGFGVGITRAAVPPVLVEEAQKRSFPLFVVPLETAFRDVIAAVQRAVSSSEARAFGRLAAAQRYLVSALGHAEPRRCVLERLAELTDADAALLDRRGAVLAGRCSVGKDDRWAAVENARHHAQRVETATGGAWLFAVGDGEALAEAWLVVTPNGGGIEHPLLKPAAQIAVPLLEATSRLEEAHQGESQALRRSVLTALLEAEDDQAAESAGARASAWGVDVAAGVRVAVVKTRAVAAVAVDELLVEVEGRMGALGDPWLATSTDGEVVVLAPDAVSDQLEEILCGAHPHALVGMGRRVTMPGRIRCSHLDGQLTVAQISRRGTSRIASYEDLDLGTAIVGEVQADRIQDKVDRWLMPVLENPMAYETLVTYLDLDLDVGRTSRALGLHPNSTRYRLARVEELLGVPLRRASTIAGLHFALLSKRFNDCEAVESARPLLRAV